MELLTGPNAESNQENVGQYQSEIENKIELLKKLARTFLGEVGSLSMLESQDHKRGLDFYGEVRRFEISLIERALLQTGGHQRRAAELLGIGATTLNAKLKQYQIGPCNDEADQKIETRAIF